jgi:hypothetical protein
MHELAHSAGVHTCHTPACMVLLRATGSLLGHAKLTSTLRSEGDFASGVQRFNLS